MFSNIIYFISALIISVLYQQSKSPNISSFTSISGLFASLILFYLISSKAFKKLNRLERINEASIYFSRYMSKLSILAIAVFALNIYVLELPDIFIDFYLFKKLPTLVPLVLMAVFSVFMWILWGTSHTWFKTLNNENVSLKEYIFTQSNFALPSIFPWFMISIVFDLLSLLPFESLKYFLNTVYGQVIYTIALVIVISAFIPVIIKKFWKCRKLEDSETLEILNNLSEKTGVEYREALMWPLFGGKMITAGVIGLFKRFRYILATPGFTDYLNPQEKAAVIAHEFGHIKKNHLLWYLVIFMGFIIVSYSVIEPLAFAVIVFSPMHLLEVFQSLDKMPTIIIALLLLISFLIYFRFLFGYFMRNFEREADAYSFEVTGSAFPLVSTFKKISLMSAESPDKPNWHHFSIKERVDFLLECQDTKDASIKHSRKVKKTLILYFIIMAVTLSAGTKTNELGQNSIYMNRVENIIHYEISKNPENREMYHHLGDLMVQKGNDIKAVKAYKKALEANPDSVETLNNLAWLYITSADKNIKNPEKGLLLAKKAYNLEKDPKPSYLLDTLANGYLKTGDYESACILAREALKNAEKDKNYYKEQIKKICPEHNIEKFFP